MNTQDVELIALAACVRALIVLDTEERGRVLSYLLDRPDHIWARSRMAHDEAPVQVEIRRVAKKRKR